MHLDSRHVKLFLCLRYLLNSPITVFKVVISLLCVVSLVATFEAEEKTNYLGF